MDAGKLPAGLIEITAEVLALQKLRVALLLSIFACAAEPEDPRNAPSSAPLAAGWLDQPRLARADLEPGNWFTNGRDGVGSYFSPLAAIAAPAVSSPPSIPQLPARAYTPDKAL